jgi:succinate dehydrogenase / fumarate reductase, cytochrome b subunit
VLDLERHFFYNGGVTVSRAFALRKLHSLTGVAPVGLFLCVHLWTNAAALGGQRSFDEGVEAIGRIPLLPLVELLLIFLPLGFHAIYGLWLSRTASLNLARYPHGRNFAYFMQRLTGALTLVFILVHLWDFWAQKWFFGMATESFYSILSSHLSDVRYGVPWFALGYLTGIAASTYHFANGLIGFSLTWGIVTTRRAQTRVSVLATLIGTSLFLLGGATVLFFATGTRPYIPGASANMPECAKSAALPATAIPTATLVPTSAPELRK